MSGPARRILFLTTSFENGAIPNILLDLAPVWRRNGWDCRFLTLEPLPEDHASVRRCRQLGFPLESLNVSSKAVVLALFRLRKALRRLAPDLVSTHLGRADIYTPWVKGRIPQITTHHSVRRNASRLTQWGYRWSDHRIALRTGVSRACNDSFLEGGFLRTEHVVIPNPVDAGRLAAGPGREAWRAALGLGPDDQAVAVVGRLIEVKNHLRLFEAVARLRQGGSQQLHLVVAGDGPLRGALEQSARDLGIADAVKFLGAVEEVGAVYRGSDLLVLPSLWEGLGLVLLEAWTQGCPVAASRLPAIEEFVRDGETGTLFDPLESADLASALGRVLGQPARARQEAEAGRRLVETRYTPAAIAAEYEAVFRRVLAATGHS